jgi:drug/metabolite transporter (DMT)-like permease
MSWLVFAFSGPVLWAISTHMDKYLVDKYFKDSNAAVLLIFTALIGLLALSFIVVLAPGVLALNWASAALMASSGVLYMGGTLFYLRALQAEEASTVAPFFQASPFIGYVLAYLVLGETLSGVQMAGGILIVTGTMLVSLRRGQMRFNIRLAALMLAAALLLASSSLIFKIFALRDEFWPTTFWMFMGEALFGAALLIPYRGPFLALLRRNPGAVLSINAVNELVNLGGGLGMRYALVLAPLSLVQAVGSTTTLFVFIFGVILSIFVPSLGREDLARAELLRKGAAAVLVAIGAALVSG